MTTVLIYIVSIVTLSLCVRLSRKAIFHLSHVFTPFKRFGILIYSLMYLPGTVIHEISHFFTAAMLGVRTGKIAIFPKETEKNRIQMGSVQVAKTDFVRSSLIGVAPFVVGNILLLYLVAQIPLDFSVLKPAILLSQLSMQINTFRFWIVIYAILTISNTLFTSREDRRHWPVLVVMVLILAGIMRGLDISINVPGNIASIVQVQSMKIAIAFLVASMLNLVVFAMLKILQYIMQKIRKKNTRYK